MAKKLKPQHERFCQLVAKGGMTLAEAYTACGYAPKKAKDQASRLHRRDKIQERIAVLQHKHAQVTTTDAEWIRDQLKMVIAKSGTHEEIMVKGPDGEMISTGEFKYDAPGVNKALDTLNRMNGGYEKDNTQKSGNIKVKMEF